MSDAGYTLIYEPNAAAKASVSDLKALLEKSKDDVKIDAMKQIIIAVLGGNTMPELLMHVIRFVMPSKNKELKKLLYFYWEVCPKMDTNGKMRHEMILVCNAIQHDLQHPNEYVRGNTLRFLCKLKEPELLETLVPNVRQCLAHRHAYVRKNAVFALYSIYKTSEHLIPDAPELIRAFLDDEFDSVCKRNAFVCLAGLDREATLQYIQQTVSDDTDPILQLAFVEFIRRDGASAAPGLRARYAAFITEIIESPSSSVVYEAAITLISLTSASKSIILAGTKLVELANKEADNNVKIITLQRISELNKKHPGLLLGLSLDLLAVLSTQDLDVRRKALDVTLTLITSRNVEDVVKLLKKEVQRSAGVAEENGSEYRQLLINTIHLLAIEYGEVATNVIDLLLESIGDLSTTAARDVISFVKEVVEKYPALRSDVVHKLINSLPNVKSGTVFRGALWILGEYSDNEGSIKDSWKFLRSSIGEVPILASERKHLEGTEEAEDPKESKDGSKKAGPVVLPDGTYATETAFSAKLVVSESDDSNQIRKLILGGDFFLAAVLSSTLVKLVLRLETLGIAEQKVNVLRAEALLIMVSILRVGETSFVKERIDEDSADRILACIKFLTGEDASALLVRQGFLEDTRTAFQTQIEAEQEKKNESKAKEFQENVEQVDDCIAFRQFDKNDGAEALEEEDAIFKTSAEDKDLSSRLNRILQLTGFSDPLYAEAFVKVHHHDITLEVMLVNQTTATMRNLTAEFATLGDIKIVDRPASTNLGPHGFHRLSVTFKVSAADTAIIFGNIVYDGQHSDESNIVILNEIRVDIMDYIKPATCSENTFRKMWAEFEWENKISIKVSMSSLKEYLKVLMEKTNTTCLTPGAITGEECNFLAANLYSRSTFGEDALANLSIERLADGVITGHVRIRSESQGLAIALGDRVGEISRSSKTNIPVKV